LTGAVAAVHAVVAEVAEVVVSVPSHVEEEQLCDVQERMANQVVACERILEELRDYEDTEETNAMVEWALTEDTDRAQAAHMSLIRVGQI
jgi:hypothetical protein